MKKIFFDFLFDVLVGAFDNNNGPSLKRSFFSQATLDNFRKLFYIVPSMFIEHFFTTNQT